MSAGHGGTGTPAEVAAATTPRAPGRATLVYDGDCGFCTRSAHFVKRVVDRRDRYDVRPWQELDLEAMGLTARQCDEAAQFVGVDASVESGHRAVASALRNGSPGWRPVGHLVVAPGISWVAARAYRWVAEHRHQLPGGTAACARPGS